MTGKAIVLDANILIRGVLGKRVRQLVLEHAETIKFFAPDVAYKDVRKHLPALLKKRRIETAEALAVLDCLEAIIRPIEVELYESLQQQALLRIAVRDADDWPVLACAMMFDCPVWTEDSDFFGTGVATWTTDIVALYLTA